MHSSRLAYVPWFGQPGMPQDTQDFNALPRAAALRFFGEFVSRIDERVNALEAEVRATPGFESWRPIDAQDAWFMLGEWVLRRLTLEERTVYESPPARGPRVAKMDLEKNRRSFVAIELDDVSTSLAGDVAMLMTRAVLAFHPRATLWMEEDRRSHSEHMPVVGVALGDKRESVLNPLEQGVGKCWQIATRKFGTDHLYALVSWSQRAIAWRTGASDIPKLYEPRD